MKLRKKLLSAVSAMALAATCMTSAVSFADDALITNGGPYTGSVYYLILTPK